MAADKSPVATDDDEVLLKSAKWRRNEDGTWSNPRSFVCRENGRTVAVPIDIIRETAEAARLERLRPKQ